MKLLRKYILLLVFLMQTVLLFAGSTIEQLETKIKTTGENEDKYNILIELARFHRDDDPVKSLNYAKDAYNLALKLQNQQLQAASAVIIGLIYSSKFGDLNETLKYYNLALNIYKSLGNSLDVADTYNLLGVIYKSIGNYDKALEQYYASLKIAEKAGQKLFMSKIYNNIGNIYLEQSNLEKALANFLNAQKLKEELGDKRGIASTLNNIGVTNKKLKRFNEALKDYERTLTIYEELGDQQGKSDAYNNIGNIYQSINNINKAIAFHQKAANLRQKTGDNAGYASSLNNIGNCLNSKGDYRPALEYYLKSLSAYQSIPDSVGITTSYLNIGNIYIKLSDYKSAFSYLDRGILFSRQIKRLDLTGMAYYSYSLLYSNLGDHKKSDYYYKQYISINDTLLSEDSRKKVADMQVKYNTAQKELQNKILEKENSQKDLVIAEQRRIFYFWISFSVMILVTAIALWRMYRIKQKTNHLLEEKNEELNEKNDLLEDANHELLIANQKLKDSEDSLREINKTKDKFFSIIAHDLRNPFTSLSITLDMIRIHNEKMDKTQYDNLIFGMQNTIEKASDLLENLLEWSRSQTGSINFEPGNISLTQVIGEIIMLMNGPAITKNILFKVSLDEEVNVYADKNMLSTIIRNLVSNAIKFTHPGGFVDISYKKNGSLVTVRIEDNGIGISNENLKYLFRLDSNYKTRGTANEKGTGLGLVLCKEFIGWHKGKIWAESEIGKGSVFCFTVPNAESLMEIGISDS